MVEELTYRQERFAWRGDTYWQRACPPWCLVTTLHGVNISRSGLLAEGEAQALTTIFDGGKTRLQLNGENCCAVVEAVCVRRQDERVAFAFVDANADLEQLLAEISAAAR